MRLCGSAMGASRKEGGGGGVGEGLYGHAPSSFRVEMLSVRLSLPSGALVVMSVWSGFIASWARFCFGFGFGSLLRPRGSVMFAGAIFCSASYLEDVKNRTWFGFWFGFWFGLTCRWLQLIPLPSSPSLGRVHVQVPALVRSHRSD